jgi:hypothetical protein
VVSDKNPGSSRKGQNGNQGSRAGYDMLRKYHLDSIRKPGGLRIWYYLVFCKTVGMFVEETYDFDLPYKNHKVNSIRPEDFDKYELNGKLLRQLVAEKLVEILPPSN